MVDLWDEIPDEGKILLGIGGGLVAIIVTAAVIDNGCDTAKSEKMIADVNQRKSKGFVQEEPQNISNLIKEQLEKCDDDYNKNLRELERDYGASFVKVCAIKNGFTPCVDYHEQEYGRWFNYYKATWDSCRKTILQKDCELENRIKNPPYVGKPGATPNGR